MTYSERNVLNAIENAPDPAERPASGTCCASYPPSAEPLVKTRACVPPPVPKSTLRWSSIAREELLAAKAPSPESAVRLAESYRAQVSPLSLVVQIENFPSTGSPRSSPSDSKRFKDMASQ